MSEEYTFVSVVIACKNADQAAQIGRAAVEQKLAACAQTHSARSTYVWQGDICEDDETLLTLKTTATCFEALRQFVRENHTYDVPQIAAMPITYVDADYAAWIMANVKR